LVASLFLLRANSFVLSIGLVLLGRDWFSRYDRRSFRVRGRLRRRSRDFSAALASKAVLVAKNDRKLSPLIRKSSKRKGDERFGVILFLLLGNSGVPSATFQKSPPDRTGRRRAIFCQKDFAKLKPTEIRRPIKAYFRRNQRPGLLSEKKNKRLAERVRKVVLIQK
jgi:hypothetical protein